MKGDFSRSTFDPRKHYSGVYMQQGRVQVDADWNEQVEILRHRIEVGAADLIGKTGVPRMAAGFEVSVRGGIDLTGNDQYVSVEANPSLQIGDRDPFTVEMEIAPRRSSTDAELFARLVESEDGLVSDHVLRVLRDGRLSFKRVERTGSEDAGRGSRDDEPLVQGSTGDVARTVVTSVATVQMGERSHLAVTYDGQRIRIFLNGQIVGVGQTLDPGLDGVPIVRLGGGFERRDDISCYHGRIYGVRIWKTELTPDTIRLCAVRPLYDAGPGLVADWRFLEGGGRSVTDASEFNNHGVLRGQWDDEDDGWVKPEILLGSGRCYVEGILCESEGPVSFNEQPDNPTERFDLTRLRKGPHVVYLDVWRREMSVLDDPEIKESALGGADTTLRVKTVWQARCHEEGAANTFSDPGKRGTLQARHARNGIRLDNRLLRVEVHEPGFVPGASSDVTDYRATGRVTTDGRIEMVTQATDYSWRGDEWVRVRHAAEDHTEVEVVSIVSIEDSRLETQGLGTEFQPGDEVIVDRLATFKWSTDNGSVAAAVTSVQGALVTVEDDWPHAQSLGVGDWVELVDSDDLLGGRSGAVVQILDVDRSLTTGIRITLNKTPWTNRVLDPSKRPRLLRWDADGRGDASCVQPIRADRWTPLYGGLEVRFEEDTGFRQGDYWWIPTRSDPARIGWPRENGKPVKRTPSGRRHHYCALARLSLDDRSQVVVEDLRNVFGPLDEAADDFVRKSGDLMHGQLTVESDFQVTGDAFVGSNLFAHRILGRLGPETVGSEQIVNGSVTEEKLASDVSIGIPPSHYLMGPSNVPPTGFRYTGSRIPIRHGMTDWVSTDQIAPGDTGEALIGDGVWVYALSADGRFSRFRIDGLDIADPVEPLPDPPWEERRHFAMCVADGKLFVAGGEVAGEKSADVFIFDLSTFEWVETTPLQIPRSHLGLAWVDGRLHAFGGLRRWGPFQNQTTNLHEIFSPVSKTWSFTRSLKTRCHSMGVTVGDGEIFSVGGESIFLFRWLARWKTHAVQVYRVSSSRWSRSARLPFGRSNPGATIADEYLYVFGGKRLRGDSADCHALHVPSRKWTRQTPLSVPRAGMGWSQIGDSVFVAGGTGSKLEAGVIERRLIRTEFFVHERLDERSAVTPRDD